MEKHPLAITDIVLGEGLRWDVYDAQDNLLMRKGYVVANQRQLDSLLERGLFAEAIEYAASQDAAKPLAGSNDETRSAVRLINQAHAQMVQLAAELPSLTGQSNLAATVLAIIGQIEEAIEISPDIALACILFGQKAEGYAVRHCIDAAIIALILARSLGKPDAEVATIGCAALTMNVSMLPLQEALQNREAGPTPEESILIRRHPEMSAKILQQAGVADAEWLSILLHHHENIDGTGYPFGKTDESIPENAKLLSLVDRYTALISPRAYRKAIFPSEALGKLLIDRGKGVDTTLVAHFIRTLGIYPPGAFVKLQSGEIAVVSHRSKKQGAGIIAHALIGPFGAPLAFPHKRETGNERYEIRLPVHVSQTDIPFSMHQIWGAEAAA